MGMNLIISAAEREIKGHKTSTGIRLPTNRGFVDNITVTTTKQDQARWVFDALDGIVSWARINFKPQKSRCLIIKKGKVTKKFTLKKQGKDIPSMVDKPVKY